MEKRRQGLRLELVPTIAQVQWVTPAIANDRSSMKKNSIEKKTRELPEGTLNHVQQIISEEDVMNPYYDSQILTSLKATSSDYKTLTTRDVAYARKELGIKPSRERLIE